VTEELEKKMAVLEYRVNELTEESDNHRQRLHTLENDRALVRLVVQQMEKLVGNMEAIAERVAEKTVARMLEARSIAARSWREHTLQFAQLAIALVGAYFVFRR
jgi:hypothetical protein